MARDGRLSSLSLPVSLLLEEQSVSSIQVTCPALLTFYVQTWDEYHTKTLTLGLISGPVEGIVTLCIVYAITALKGGASFWQQSLLSTIGVPTSSVIPDLLYNLAWNEWYMVYGGMVLVYNTVAR